MAHAAATGARGRRGRYPRGTAALVATRFLLYLGIQTSYFIGLIGALTYQMDASTWTLAVTVGIFSLFIIAGTAAGGTLLDVAGPRLHTACALAAPLVSSVAFQFVPVSEVATIVMGAVFGASCGLAYTYLTAYPAYLTSDADELKRVNALLSVVSNAAVMIGPAIGAVIATWLPAQRVFLADAFLSVVAVPASLALLRVIARRLRGGNDAAGAGSRSVDRRHVELAGEGGAPRAPQDTASSPDRRSVASGGDLAARTCDNRGDVPATFGDSARVVFGAPSLALLFWVGALAYAGYGAFDPLESLFYRDVLKVDIAWMGWLSSAAGVGSVVGGALAARVPRDHVNVRALLVLIALEGAACLVYVGTPYVAVALAGQLLLGTCFGMVTPLQNTLVQVHAPRGVLGRVMSIMTAGFNGAGAIPLFAAPVLADIFGVQGVLIGASCVVLAVPVAVLAFRHRQIASLVAREREGAARAR